ncbi:DUF3040 domain-containing protein [Kribbella sp. CA-247076]|uniref:DUF3040 domain-containing protein n=1 Tax=Kribbella sp. CA-247076 TaxID=3239941 RepID=UPI003D91527A
MLSEDERRKLDGIQHQFADEDPAFVADFQARVRRLPRGDPGVTARSRVYAVMIGVAVLLGLLQLVDGVVGGALFMATIAGGAYFARHRDLRRAPPG